MVGMRQTLALITQGFSFFVAACLIELSAIIIATIKLKLIIVVLLIAFIAAIMTTEIVVK